MTRRGVIWLLAGSVLAGTLVRCGNELTIKSRQKMTVEVDTPNGVRSGFAVVEVGNSPKPDALRHIPGNGYFVRGEAVAVDIASGKTLFALLAPSDAGDPSWYQAELINDAVREGAAAGPTVTLPPQVYPLLLTFRDVRDPTSVERVDPADLAATFGPGVTLRRITVAVTDDPVTTGIEKRLGWLAQSEDGGLVRTGRVAADLTFAEQLGFLDFRRK